MEPEVAFVKALKELGVDARIVERTEQKHAFAAITSLVRSWLTGPSAEIEIDGGPVSAVSLWSKSEPKADYYDYFTDYLVGDVRIDRSLTKLSLKPVLRTRFPVVGDYVDVSWKGNDRRLGIVGRLQSDASLKKQLIDGRVDDLIIQADPKRRAWMLRRTGWQSPSRELWSCYQTIARHLLETPVGNRTGA
jgi:hypothetical protein